MQGSRSSEEEPGEEEADGSLMGVAPDGASPKTAQPCDLRMGPVSQNRVEYCLPHGGWGACNLR